MPDTDAQGEQQADVSRVIADLTARVEALESERQCLTLLALYAHGADYRDADAWLDLFTPDAIVDTISFYGADPENPVPADFRANRMHGRDELRAGLIEGAQSAAMSEFITQHHMVANPMGFRLIDPTTARITTYGIVYGKHVDDVQPHVTYQSHTTNRWTFTRTGEGWRIAELVRRKMGHPDGKRLITD